jgi:hypothetical protein
MIWQWETQQHAASHAAARATIIPPGAAEGLISRIPAGLGVPQAVGGRGQAIQAKSASSACTASANSYIFNSNDAPWNHTL